VNGKGGSSDFTVPFFFLTYAVTWVCTAIAFNGGIASSRPRFFVSGSLLLIGSFAPSVVAFGLTALGEGAFGMRALLLHLFDWRVAVRWYVLSISYPLIILVAAYVAHRVITGVWLPLSHPRWLAIVSSIVLSMPVRASEEIGWRGYALPRLSKEFGLRKASLALGPIWACWHLPLFFVPGMGSYGQSVPMFVLEVTGLSVAFAWLYGKTNGSLLPVILMHSAINEVFAILPRPKTSANPLAFSADLILWLITAIAWLMAAYFLARMPTSHETESIPAVQH
jgi:membrane protease YdiL (CAAX protease family)